MRVCVLGMHRSGTSMVANALAQVGVPFGAPDQHIAPSPENQLGYWELRSVLAVNNAALAQVGAGWDHPPSSDHAWLDAPELDAARHAAKDVAEALDAADIRAWKDPRCSFTLPIWEHAAGSSIAVVVCLRSPIDVARSLDVRGQMSRQLACSLWSRYTRASLDLARTRRAVVTHSSSWFFDPHAELHRVAGALGLGPSDELVARAVARAVRPDLNHHVSPLADVVSDARIPDEVAARYLAACDAAGPVLASSLASDVFSFTGTGSATASDVAALTADVRELRAGIGVAGVPLL